MPFRCDSCGRHFIGCYDDRGRHYRMVYDEHGHPSLVACEAIMDAGDASNVEVTGRPEILDGDLLLTEADIDGAVLFRNPDGAIVLREPRPWWPVVFVVGAVIAVLAGIALFVGDDEAHAACRATHSDATCVYALR